MQRLQEAGSRLRAPEKAHAFGLWAHLLVEKHERLQREQLTGFAKRELDLQTKCAKLERDIEHMQTAYDLMLARAEEEKQGVAEGCPGAWHHPTRWPAQTATLPVHTAPSAPLAPPVRHCQCRMEVGTRDRHLLEPVQDARA